MTIIQALRSALFYLLFLGQTVVLALVIGTLGRIFGRTQLGWNLSQYWGRSNLWFLRWVVGIRTDVAGEENIPPGSCILAAKHMSDWDIFALLPASKRPAFIAKKELMDLPFFGQAARAFDTIRLDRSQGGEAIPTMLEDARAALARGARIIIFPEGTRKAPLDEHDYRYGIVRLYLGLNVPVVPAAVNSGLFWGRNSPLLWRGTARARFLPAIPPGLPPEEFRTRLIAAIEGETNTLLLQAYEEGLARPIPDDMFEKFEALKAGNPPGPAAQHTTA